MSENLFSFPHEKFLNLIFPVFHFYSIIEQVVLTSSFLLLHVLHFQVLKLTPNRIRVLSLLFFFLPIIHKYLWPSRKTTNDSSPCKHLLGFQVKQMMQAHFNLIVNARLYARQIVPYVISRKKDERVWRRNKKKKGRHEDFFFFFRRSKRHEIEISKRLRNS